MSFTEAKQGQQESLPAQKHWRLALWLAAVGALSAGAVIPYTLALLPALAAKLPMSLALFVLVQTAQAAAMFLLLAWAGLRMGARGGLDSPIARAWVYGKVMPKPLKLSLGKAALIGAVTAALIMLLDNAFQAVLQLPSPAENPHPDLWKRLLACFYGGIGEEILLRLGLMSAIVWFIWKLVLRAQRLPTERSYWFAIVLAAILFGVGHLPAVANMWPLTAAVIARTVVLNAIGGIAFGFLYWRRGLEHAMAAHFAADIVLHVVGGI